MTLSLWQHKAREAPVKCDVAVVGGGIIGCATAFWLSRIRPSLQLSLLEAAQLAGGASGRNAGFLLQGSARDYLSDVSALGTERTRRLWQFARESRDLLVTASKGHAFDLETNGSLTVAGTKEEDDRLKASVTRMRTDGALVAYTPPAEANRRLGSEHFFGGLYLPSGAAVNPVKLVRYLASESGAQILEGHRVLRLEGEPGNILIETPARSVLAKTVILALNAYLPKLYPVLSRFVHPIRAQMLATEPLLPRWLHMPVYTHGGYYYVRQTADGVVMAGGARHLHTRDEVGYADETTTALQRDLEDYLHHHFPQTRPLRIQHRWSGVMGFSPDHAPVIGSVPDFPGSYWVAGFTGHGMGYGFRMGRLMAELASGAVFPDGYDLFSEDRFASEKKKGILANLE